MSKIDNIEKHQLEYEILNQLNHKYYSTDFTNNYDPYDALNSVIKVIIKNTSLLLENSIKDYLELKKIPINSIKSNSDNSIFSYEMEDYLFIIHNNNKILLDKNSNELENLNIYLKTIS